MSELIDDDGYPTAAALDKIKTFSGTPREFIEFVESIWWPQGDSERELPKIGPTLGGWYVHHWSLATAGWSGNEEIIEAMEKTIFWLMYWQQSTRGGGYSFHIRDVDMDRAVEMRMP